MASSVTSSNQTAFSAATSSNYGAANAFNTKATPKFNEYRSRVMLGNLPQDFLRVQFVPVQIHDPAMHAMRSGHPLMQQQMYQNPNFLGYFTLTIAEAKLVKNSSLLGLMKMDPYVTFRIGHVTHETPIAAGGGKNPQWKASYRLNLFKGMDRIHLEVYDQRNFTEDSFIGESEIPIPREVFEGETYQHWYPLMGRDANANENQGDILLIMSLMSIQQSGNHPAVASSSATPVANADENGNNSAGNNATPMPAELSHRIEQQQQQQQHSVTQHTPSAIPKPPPPPYSAEDIQTIQEMFPTTDRRIITDLLDQHGGNKDLVVNQLLQNIA